MATSQQPAEVPAAERHEVSGRLSRFRRICVFGGTEKGRKSSYHAAAVELGHELVEKGLDLVYGGGSAGLTGLVSSAVQEGGRHVIGIVYKSLVPRESMGETVGEIKPVSSMHERKAEMARQADAFIALPGGYRTLEEFMEIITWYQLGIHKKPVGLLNVNGFYDPLLAFIDGAVEEGFITQAARSIIISATSARDLLRKMEECALEYEIHLVWDDPEPRSETTTLAWDDSKPCSLVPEPESGMAT